MRIAIVGAGAMGCIYGGFLSRAGHDVWLIVKRDADAQIINERGVILCEAGVESTVRLRATSCVEEAGIADLVLFLVKSFDTASAARQARPLFGPNTYAMTLQNGVGNVEAIINELGMDRFIYGVSYSGGGLKGPGYAEVDAVASDTPIRIGDWSGEKSAMLLKTCQVFNDAGIPTEVVDDAQSLLWKTVTQKCAMLMLTGLTRLRVGDLLDLEEGRELVSMATAEILQVANAKGVKALPDLEQTMEKAVKVAQETSHGHITSMLAAILNQKKTEVDSLGEAIANEAEHLEFSAPVNRTLALLTRIIEKSYDRALTGH